MSYMRCDIERDGVFCDKISGHPGEHEGRVDGQSMAWTTRRDAPRRVACPTCGGRGSIVGPVLSVSRQEKETR